MEITYGFVKKSYEMAINPPKPIDENAYFEKAKQEYLILIEKPLQESIYQDFFERNPGFMPGAHGVLGAASSHLPIQNALISQPILSNNKIQRKPDFMWIAKDSLCLSPVIIEIEKPSKKEFRLNNDIGLAQFNQAEDQIIQWRSILNSPEGILDFYNRYKIPETYRKLKFIPQYVLIYGRRSEYETNDWLTQNRAEEQRPDFHIMSFDRLASLDRNAYDCVTCKVSNGEYTITYIPPTFVFRPSTIDAIGGYTKYNGFAAAVDKMEYTTDERKRFLKERFQYWQANAQNINNSLISTSDME